MLRTCRRATLPLTAIVLLALTGYALIGRAAAAPAPAEPPKDCYGDPLPPGAIARLGSLRLRAPTRALAFAPDSKMFATGGEDRVIHLWDSFSGRAVRQFQGHTRAIAALVFTSDGKHLIAAGDDARAIPAGPEDGIRVWEVPTGRELQLLRQERPARSLPRPVVRPEDAVLGRAGRRH